MNETGWKDVHDVNRLDLLVRRAFHRRGLTAKMSPHTVVHEACYLADDGYTTQGAVLISDLDSGLSAVGYGVAVKGGRDTFEEYIGANIAITRAFECAATVLKQKLQPRGQM